MGTHHGPWVHIKACGYTSRPVGTHQGPWVHIKARGCTSRPVGTHQGPWVHIKASGYTSRPVGTHQGPWLHIKARGCTSRPVGTHQGPRVHIKARGYTSRPVSTHQGPWVHIKTRGYTSRPVGTHQGPWVHIKARGYTSRPVGTHQGRWVVRKLLYFVALRNYCLAQQAVGGWGVGLVMWLSGALIHACRGGGCSTGLCRHRPISPRNSYSVLLQVDPSLPPSCLSRGIDGAEGCDCRQCDMYCSLMYKAKPLSLSPPLPRPRTARTAPHNRPTSRFTQETRRAVHFMGRAHCTAQATRLSEQQQPLFPCVYEL